MTENAVVIKGSGKVIIFFKKKMQNESSQLPSVVFSVCCHEFFVSLSFTVLFTLYLAGDLSSASEVSDNDSDDSDSRDLSGYACRHCFTTSKSLYLHFYYRIQLMLRDFSGGRLF